MSRTEGTIYNFSVSCIAENDRGISKALVEPLLKENETKNSDEELMFIDAEKENGLKLTLERPTSLNLRPITGTVYRTHRRNKSADWTRKTVALNVDHETSARKLSDSVLDRREGESEISLTRTKMNSAKAARRKLSESRGIKLPDITIKSPSPSLSSKPHNSRSPPSKYDEAKGKQKQVSYADQQDPSTSRISCEESPPLTSSPLGYTLRHAPNLMIDTSVVGAPSTPPHARLFDVIDVTIFLSDLKGFKFSCVGGKVAPASSLLFLMAEHLGIEPTILGETCALWMVSDLLEVQLKPHHVPYDVRRNWSHLLKKFTCAELEEIYADEPLIVLKRNVLLSVERERELDDECERLTEILYLNAKEEVLNGRYLCDLDTSIHLAALQMVVELGPFDPTEHSVDMIRDVVAMYFPIRHRHSVRTVYLFGFPVIGCKGLENDILEEFKSASEKYHSNHERRKAYLEILRPNRSYGAAFFRGQVERPPAGSLKNIKRLLLAATMPDIQVIVGVNRDYCTVLDPSKHELLLAQSLFDCSWRRVDIEAPLAEVTSATKEIGLPCFLLFFPDESENRDRTTNINSEQVQIPEKNKLLQVFSRQAVMIEALMTALYRIELIEAEQLSLGAEVEEMQPVVEEAIAKSGDGVRRNASMLELIPVNESSPDSKGIHDEMDGGHVNSSYYNHVDDGVLFRRGGSPVVVSASVYNEDTSPKSKMTPEVCWARRSPFRGSSPSPFTDCSKLCLATFDATGRCVEAQGSLRRVLQEVS